MDKNILRKDFEKQLKFISGKDIEEAKDFEIFKALSMAIVNELMDRWTSTTNNYRMVRKAHYFSAEYLMGRAFGNNLINLGIYDEVKEILDDFNIDINKVENIEQDAGLGNGGLGRLAACFMDSAATLNMPINGYGIRYKNRLFNQKLEHGEQYEETDNWLKYGDPWSVRRSGDAVVVNFKDESIRAIPYDTPIIGYNTYIKAMAS